MVMSIAQMPQMKSNVKTLPTTNLFHRVKKQNLGVSIKTTVCTNHGYAMATMTVQMDQMNQMISAPASRVNLDQKKVAVFAGPINLHVMMAVVSPVTCSALEKQNAMMVQMKRCAVCIYCSMYMCHSSAADTRPLLTLVRCSLRSLLISQKTIIYEKIESFA